jgi:tetratricopeptide (TPR) repeat protein
VRVIARLGWRPRLVVALGVLVLALLVRQHLAGMDQRFFRPSLRGAEGFVRYVLGDYAGAARAYRAHQSTGYEPLPGLPSAPPPTAENARTGPQAISDLLADGESALARNDLAEAENVYARVLAIETDQFDAALLTAVINSRRGQYGEAIRAFNRALRHSRTETRSASFLAALETTGELTALPASTRPRCLLAHYHRYLRIFDASHADAAIRHAKAAIADGDHADDCWFTIGMVHRAQRKPHASLDAFTRAIALNPRHAGALHASGNIYQERGDLLNERRMRTAALAAAPTDVFYAEPLLDLLILRAGDYREAVTVGEAIHARQPQNAVATQLLGEAHALLGDYAVGERYLRQALDRDPWMERAHYALAWTLMQQRKDSEAVEEFEAAIALAPFVAEYYQFLAILHQRQRRHADVIQVSGRALRVGLTRAELYAFRCAAFYELKAFREYEACVPQLLAGYTGGVIALPSVPEAFRTLGLPLPIR